MPIPTQPSSETANLEHSVLNLYEADFYAWTQEQARLLRDRCWGQVDWSHLIEEVESLGRQQRQELRNRLSVLIGHLLKWQYQSRNRSRSWLATLRIQRLDIADLLADNPSLQPYLEEAMGRAYLKGVALAMQETDLPSSTFPADCPYGLAQALAEEFYPGEPSNLIEGSGDS